MAAPPHSRSLKSQRRAQGPASPGKTAPGSAPAGRPSRGASRGKARGRAPGPGPAAQRKQTADTHGAAPRSRDSDAVAPSPTPNPAEGAPARRRRSPHPRGAPGAPTAAITRPRAPPAAMRDREARAPRLDKPAPRTSKPTVEAPGRAECLSRRPRGKGPSGGTTGAKKDPAFAAGTLSASPGQETRGACPALRGGL